MVDNTIVEVIEERRVNSRRILESLIHSRTETLAQYKHVMSYQPFEMSDILQEVLEDFCELLVDYAAKAHFNLYKHLDNNTERRKSVLNIADSVYPSLLDNTQKILDFHDQYNSDVSQMAWDKLENCLNDVGELLADRISFEDDIINAILSPRSV